MKTLNLYVKIGRRWVWIAQSQSALLIKQLSDKYNEARIVVT